MELRPISYYLPELKKRLESRSQEPALQITSLPALNRKIWGLPDNKLVVIGSRTSMGKTSFIMQILSDLAYDNIPVLYVSFEMSPEEILERMFINRYRINNLDLLTGRVDLYKKQLDEFSEKSKNVKLIIAQRFGKNWDDINNLFETINKNPNAKKFRVVVIDYIQAIVDGTTNTKKFMDDYLLNFRSSCVRNSFCGVIVSQLNRSSPESKDKRPQLHHLKGCIHGDSIVNGYKKRDFVKNKMPYPIKSFDIHKKIPLLKFPSDFIDSGKKDCIEIKTKSGKEIVISKCTKVFNGKKWIVGESLRVGEKILVDYGRTL